MGQRPWAEAADGIFLRSYDALDINICAIAGGDELVVVDSRSSPGEASELLEDLGALAPAKVAALVNTHAHFDHTFGNQVFAAVDLGGVPIYGHHRVPDHLAEYETPRLAAWRRGTGDEPPRDWDDVVITPPTVLIVERTTLHVGTRPIELIPLGPGHTDTDLVVHVPDARTWIVGDVVEASGPPMFGSGCYPLQLPLALEGLLEEIEPGDTIIPGHGPIVDRRFVEHQLVEVTRLAARIRAAYSAGLTADEALSDQTGWPFPVENLRLAVTRSFDSLEVGE